MANPVGKFKIQTVAEMTGVPASTLRTWEQRYGFPSPDRTASAYRMYSQSDIDQIARRQLSPAGTFVPTAGGHRERTIAREPLLPVFEPPGGPLCSYGDRRQR